MPAGGLALGLDLGGSSVKSAIVSVYSNASGEVGPEGIHTIPRSRSIAEVLATIDDIVAGVHRDVGKVGSIGLGLPGIFDDGAGTPTLLPNFPPEWIGYGVREAVEARVGQPVRLVNDAKAFTVAESLVGAGAGLANVACLVLGTGVGGGVVLDGELWRGSGSAGELGHLTVELDGPPCGCGSTGCVEAYAGAEAIAEFGGRTSAEAVFAAAAAGDRLAQAAIDRAVRAIGAAMANVFVTVAPDIFVVGGGVASAGGQLIPRLRAELRRRIRVAPPDRLAVVPGSLGRNAGAIGAAMMSARLPVAASLT